MKDLAILAAVIGAWFLLQTVVLPYFGIST
jgi:hypothetical protein